MMVKILLNTVTRECISDSSFLGFEGENQANVLDFSFSDKFVDGTAVLNIKRGKDTGFVSVDKVASGYQLPVKSSLLSQVGDITFQFVITKSDGTIMKFDSFVMTVEDAIDTDVPLPEEYPSWVEMANTKLAEIDVAIEQANKISNQILVDKANGVFDGKDGEDGVNGTDGISPVVKTEQTVTGAKITITDVNGTHIAEVFNGKDGKDGADGKDGTLTFEELTEEQKATLKGEKGDKGDKGEKGDKGDTGTTGANGKDGENGKDGLTPHIGNNGNWWIGETDTGVKAEGSSEGGDSVNGRKVTELLESPIEYALNKNGGENIINQNLSLLDDIANYDEIVFSWDIHLSEGYGIANENRFLTSNFIYNNTDNAIFNGSIYQITYATSVYFSVQMWFKDGTTIRIQNTQTSVQNWNGIRIKNIRGIKY